MRVSDITAVSNIERLSFPQPWPQSAYRREIVDNRMAYYIIARHLDAGAPERPAEPLAQTRHPEAGEDGFLGRLQRLFRPGEDPSASSGIDPNTVGYAGLWLMAQEAHVTTIAVHPDHRG